MSYIISIDPGIFTGYAVWDAKTFKDHSTLPVKVGILSGRTKRSDSWETGVVNLMDLYLKEIPQDWNVIEGHIELPQYFDSVGGSMTAKRGDLVKLTIAAGVIAGAIRSRGGNVKFHEVNTWKGQLPKEVVISRIRRKLPTIDTLGVDDHMWDAVGIGMYVRGQL